MAGRSWPGDIDIAPDAMYREIKSKGTWVLEQVRVWQVVLQDGGGCAEGEW